MNNPNFNTGKIVSDFLMGLMTIVIIILVLGAIFGTPIYISSKNNEKVQNMTDICISKGYDGWSDDDRGYEHVKRSYCYNEGDDSDD